MYSEGNQGNNLCASILSGNKDAGLLPMEVEAKQQDKTSSFGDRQTNGCETTPLNNSGRNLIVQFYSS